MTVSAIYVEPCGSFQIAIADVALLEHDMLTGEPLPEASGFLITRINVPAPYRRRGLGTKLLERICRDADACNATLQLEVLPSGGVTADALIAWYEHHCFSFVDPDNCGVLMERKPQGGIISQRQECRAPE